MKKSPAPSVFRRSFPQPDHLEEMRSELARWDFSLTLGAGGYWYAEHATGMPVLYDRSAQSVHKLALAWAQASLASPPGSTPPED